MERRLAHGVKKAMGLLNASFTRLKYAFAQDASHLVRFAVETSYLELLTHPFSEVFR